MADMYIYEKMLVKTSYWQSHQQWVWAMCWAHFSRLPLRLKSIQNKLELAEMLSKSINSLALARASTLHHLTAILTNPGHPSCLEISKCDSQGQKGWEWESRELQTCQPELSARESHGANYLEQHHMAQQNNQGITLSQRGFVRGRSCLVNLSS